MYLIIYENGNRNINKITFCLGGETGEIKSGINTTTPAGTRESFKNFNKSKEPEPTLCNGKYWGEFPARQKIYCPPIGDAQCAPAT